MMTTNRQWLYALSLLLALSWQSLPSKVNAQEEHLLSAPLVGHYTRMPDGGLLHMESGDIYAPTPDGGLFHLKSGDIYAPTPDGGLFHLKSGDIYAPTPDGGLFHLKSGRMLLPATQGEAFPR